MKRSRGAVGPPRVGICLPTSALTSQSALIILPELILLNALTLMKSSGCS